MQASGLYGVYRAALTIYNAYPHASSIYHQAAQPPWMMQPPGGGCYGCGDIVKACPHFTTLSVIIRHLIIILNIHHLVTTHRIIINQSLRRSQSW